MAMNTFYWILIIYFSIVIPFFIYAIATAKPYPKEWEESEDKELEKKFKEYDNKKSQEN
jgi:hypothetical protein